MIANGVVMKDFRTIPEGKSCDLLASVRADRLLILPDEGGQNHSLEAMNLCSGSHDLPEAEF